MTAFRFHRRARFLFVVLAGCSVVNAPDPPVEGGAGAQGATSQCQEPYTTLTDCGECGAVCEPANVDEATCADGTCSWASCATGFADCDADTANGCEIDTGADAANCGGCGQACSTVTLANVEGPACTASMCDYSMCSAGWADCDNDRTNGCELAANTLTDCGGCGVPCQPTNVVNATCATGTCGFDMCAPDYQSCDGDTANGCESARLTDEMHCGMCNNACSGMDVCNNGSCGPPIYLSCLDALTNGQLTSGTYSIDPNGGSPMDAFQVYCDMTTNGGGWTECLNVVNTTAEELHCSMDANYFDRCVDFTMAAWTTGDQVLLTLTDTNNQQIYAAWGTRTTPWTYELLTSNSPPSCPNGANAQYDRGSQHPSFITLNNGRRLTISGKGSGQAGWGGSWGNGYMIVVQTTPSYAANNEVTVMSFLHSGCYTQCTPHMFQGMTAAHEVMYGPGGTVTTYNDAALQPNHAFIGTFRFLVR